MFDENQTFEKKNLIPREKNRGGGVVVEKSLSKAIYCKPKQKHYNKDYTRACTSTLKKVCHYVFNMQTQYLKYYFQFD